MPSESDYTLSRWGNDIPDRGWRRIRWAVSIAKRPVLWLFVTPFAFASIWVAAHPPVEGGHIATWAVTAVAFGIYGWAFWWYLQRPVFDVDIPGRDITLHVERGTYYPDISRVEQVVAAVERAYADYVDDWSEVWDGIDVEVLEDPPRGQWIPVTDDAREQWEAPEDEETREIELEDGTVIGVAYPQDGRSEVYGPYVQRVDGLGAELAHFVDHHLHPGWSEGRDLAWREEAGIELEREAA